MAVAILPVMAGCAPPAPFPVKRAAKAVVPSPVVSPVKAPLLPQTVRLTGSLKAVQKVAVSPKADAQRVASVAVREGDAVRAGQVLLCLDDRDAAAQARIAAANVAQGEAAVAQAVAAYRQGVAMSGSAVAGAVAGLTAA